METSDGNDPNAVLIVEDSQHDQQDIEDDEGSEGETVWVKSHSSLEARTGTVLEGAQMGQRSPGAFVAEGQ